MKLVFVAIAAVLLCSLYAAEAAPPRGRVIRIRIIRIIPIRRRPRDIGEQAGVTCEIADPRGRFGDRNLMVTAELDTPINAHVVENDGVSQEEIGQLCDAVREQVMQGNGKVVDFEADMKPTL